LTSDERKHIEETYRQGVLNLPAKRVVIRSPYVGSSFLTLSRYKQMIGRASRAGIVEEGESVLFCSQKDYPKVFEMLTSQMDFTTSVFLERDSVIRTSIVNLFSLKVCKTINELLQFSSCLLAHVQENNHQKNMKEIFIESVKELLIERVIVAKPNAESRSRTIEVTVKEIDIRVTFDDELEISKLGQAAVKTGMTLEKARSVLKDL
jgi:POLQ-like helicase